MMRKFFILTELHDKVNGNTNIIEESNESEQELPKPTKRGKRRRRVIFSNCRKTNFMRGKNQMEIYLCLIQMTHILKLEHAAYRKVE